MNRKSILKFSVLALIAIGFGLSLIPFFGSLSPSRKAESSRQFVDLREIKVGEYKVFDHPNPISRSTGYQGFNWSIFVYRNYSGEYLAWNITMNENGVGLPDPQWGRPGHMCSNFGPSLVNNKVDESKPIKCHDQRPELDSTAAWNIAGKSINPPYEDMNPTEGEIINGLLYLSPSS